MLDRIADLLEAQDANPFRVRAYRQGAQTIRASNEAAAELVRRDQTDNPEALPNIGSGITAVIGEYVVDGKSGLLDDLEAQATPEMVLTRVPGIGRELVGRIVDQLHVQTLPELEATAHDGRLETVSGFGTRRVEGVAQALAGMLSRSAQRRQRERSSEGKGSGDDRPSVATLLDVDEEYRRLALTDELHKISPRRFNLDNEAWLPVLETQRDDGCSRRCS